VYLKIELYGPSKLTGILGGVAAVRLLAKKLIAKAMRRGVLGKFIGATDTPC
jgi:hypothetical protein